jgi:hypothetical protein
MNRIDQLVAELRAQRAAREEAPPPVREFVPAPIVPLELLEDVEPIARCQAYDPQTGIPKQGPL